MLEELLVVLVITNIVLFNVMCFSIYRSLKEIKEWKGFALHQYERMNNIFDWLANNLSEYGDFGQGDEPNVISFKKGE